MFVHGLTGNRETTWTQKDQVLWPRDLLPHDMPDVRVMTFGYDADVVRAIDVASSNTVRDHGKALATELARKRLFDGCVWLAQSARNRTNANSFIRKIDTSSLWHIA